MKLRKPKKLNKIFPRDRTDWGYVTLRQEGDGLDDKEQTIMEIDIEDDLEEEEAEDAVSPE
jgi:hypothetical protein